MCKVTFFKARIDFNIERQIMYGNTEFGKSNQQTNMDTLKSAKLFEAIVIKYGFTEQHTYSISKSLEQKQI